MGCKGCSAKTQIITVLDAENKRLRESCIKLIEKAVGRDDDVALDWDDWKDFTDVVVLKESKGGDK